MTLWPRYQLPPGEAERQLQTGDLDGRSVLSSLRCLYASPQTEPAMNDVPFIRHQRYELVDISYGYPGYRPRESPPV